MELKGKIFNTELWRERVRWWAALRKKCCYNNETYLKKKYREIHGRELDLKNPERFTEKIQWIKLNSCDPLYPKCTDKYLVREYVERKGLGHILNGLIGVYDRAGDIDFGSLPEKFVIKANHGSGWNLVCRDKAGLLGIWYKKVAVLNHWLKQDFSVYQRELHYSYIKPRLVCEEFIDDGSGQEPPDYKFFCFKGAPKFIQADYGRFSEHTRNYYDTEWNLLPFNWDIYGNQLPPEPRPEKLGEMLAIAAKLSEDFDHVRVDLYLNGGRIIFGELTFTDGSGFYRYKPDAADFQLGKMMELH